MLLLENVATNPQTSPMVRLEAYLYPAVTLQRAGLIGTVDLELAYKLNPYVRAKVAPLFVNPVSGLNRTGAWGPG